MKWTKCEIAFPEKTETYSCKKIVDGKIYRFAYYFDLNKLNKNDRDENDTSDLEDAFNNGSGSASKHCLGQINWHRVEQDKKDYLNSLKR